MDQITLRPVTAQDSEFVFRTKRAALGPYVAETYGWNEDDQRALHARRFRPAHMQVILLAEQSIGLLTVERKPDCFHLHQLFILPEWQNRGIGKRIARRLLDEADRNGQPVVLQVLKTNPRAKAFYERIGFRVVGETESHHQMRRNSQHGCCTVSSEGAPLGES